MIKPKSINISIHIIMYMVKLQFENKKQFKITLPKVIVLVLGWKKGDEIKIELDKNKNLVLKRKIK